MYRPPFSLKSAMAALVFAICMRDRMPSCMRAPPLALNMISGSLWSRAYSMASVILSPTATPMLPMKNRLLSTQTTAGMRSMSPRTVTAASLMPVLSR